MNQSSYTSNKKVFNRCLFENDVQGLQSLMDTCSYANDWVMEGMAKATAQNGWECLRVLIHHPHVSNLSNWVIRDALECVMFNAVEHGFVECITVALELVEEHNLQVVAKEALRRSVDNLSPNALSIVGVLIDYADMEQRKDLLESSVENYNTPLVTFLCGVVPLELYNGVDPLVDQVDVFAYLKMAARPKGFSSYGADVEQIKSARDAVLGVLLHNVSPEVLAYRLLLEPKQEEWEYTHNLETHLLYDWIDQQRLRTQLNKVVGESEVGDSTPSRKRKV